MKFKTTIILFVVAIIGISYIFLYEKERIPHEEWERLQKKVIPNFKSSMIKKIELNNESGRILLEKAEDDFWYIVEPERLRADNSEVNSILSDFEFMSKVGSFEQEGDKPFDLKDYGLDVPKATLTMYTGIPARRDEIRVTGPKDKYTVFVGQKLAAGDNVYVKLDNNDEVIVVPGILSDKVSKNILDLRSKWVLSYDKDAVSGLQIKTREYDIVCNKKGSFWRLDEPVNDLADLRKIKDILDKLKNLQIEYTDFLPEEETDLAKYGLDNPQYTVTIQEKGTSQSVIFGYSLDNKVYAKRTDEPTIFLLKDTILVDISKKPNDLRDRKVVRFDSIGTYGINKLEIKRASDVISIEKSLDLDWVIKSPIDIYADQDTVKNFLEKIKTLEIEEFVADKPTDLAVYGLENPVFEISVTKEEDKELAKFLVGKKLPEGRACYVKRVDEEPVYTVPTAEFYDKIENALLAFRDRLVCDFNKDLVKKIVIEKPDRTYECDITNRKGLDGQVLWELSQPIQTTADTDVINQIIWNLSFLKAERHVVEAPGDLKMFGLHDPKIKVSVTYEKVTENAPKENEYGREAALTVKSEVPPVEKTIETRTLLIGKKIEDGDKVSSYAKFTDNDLVFELSWPKIRDFNAELVPTKIFDFESLNASRLTLDYPDKSLQLERANNVWRWKNRNPDQKDIQGREVDYYVRKLSELKAIYIEQYKPTNLTQFSLDKPQLVITVGLDGRDAVLYLGKKKDTQGYYAKSKDSDYIYVIDKESFARLTKDEDGFTTVADEISIPVTGENPAIMNLPHGNPYGGSHGSPYGGGAHGGPHGGSYGSPHEKSYSAPHGGEFH
ncbi:MAG: DUF4340 domain-containing protein [wastewater metagenome]|nr:DUF4340 domain-containing protein [Candidatus Loosdrechtia aerotolerans]